MLLGFILLVLPYAPQRRRHNIRWGYTVPIFPVVVFSGLRVRLRPVLRITVTAEFFT